MVDVTESVACEHAGDRQVVPVHKLLFESIYALVEAALWALEAEMWVLQDTPMTAPLLKPISNQQHRQAC